MQAVLTHLSINVKGDGTVQYVLNMHKKGGKYTFWVQSTFLGLTMQFRLTSRDMIEPRESRVAQKN